MIIIMMMWISCIVRKYVNKNLGLLYVFNWVCFLLLVVFDSKEFVKDKSMLI